MYNVQQSSFLAFRSTTSKKDKTPKSAGWADRFFESTINACHDTKCALTSLDEQSPKSKYFDHKLMPLTLAAIFLASVLLIFLPEHTTNTFCEEKVHLGQEENRRSAWAIKSVFLVILSPLIIVHGIYAFKFGYRFPFKGPRGGHLLYGQKFSGGQDALFRIEQWFREFNTRTISFRIGPFLTVCCTKPEDVKNILNARPNRIKVVPFAGEAFESILPAIPALHFADGKAWEFHRKVGVAFMKHLKTNSMVDVFVKGASDLVNKVTMDQSTGGAAITFDAMKLFGKATADIIAQLCVGSQFQGTESLQLNRQHPLYHLNERVHLMFELLGDRMSSPIPLFFHRLAAFSWAPRFLQDMSYMEGGYDLSQYLRALIHDIYKEEKGNQASTDLIHFLHNSGVDVETALGLLLNFFAAAADPPAKTLSWLMMFFSQNPRVQELVREEVRRVYNEHQKQSGSQIYQDISKFPILVACIKETLRLKPPSLDIFGQIDDENGFEVDGKVIPNGAVLMAFFRPLMIDNMGAEDTFDWNPHRWLSNTPSTIARLEKNFHSFGGGARMCIGRQLALQEMVVVAGHLLLTHKVSLDESRGPVCEIIRGTMQPDNLYVRFTPIQA
uniref:Cytochrome P450 n=1 Tax=Pseudictyota dubia TaxID=2749911 RepID=A0A7R9WCP2_9STRA|mmetsp:Transcript_44351/g.82375  ORF Transcript_44351/g.82375 Transcript_44351/m.82375 type:complete len:613 (+) Transcript_44351:181-2019(+)|eukprot:CAMPEP_0197463598 /NCGR_PEP_ID=MMETSP1175-20131217/62252_1 /TAXON_ID=1003142 /ORGANISM="Triceratium dubium, Strain CCMP147" /LENGTH=612 /DNA_ID=CAMNT_0042999403 /DNA_START=169 /DNA_END=2007 /DNA_ORIENTATION=+